MAPEITTPASATGPRPSSKISRSRNGCSECRRRHRRCDETKPSCGFCSDTGALCSYTRGLSWGGRPFKKSRFGTCGSRASHQVVKIMSEHGHESTNRPQFVYGARQSKHSHLVTELENTASQQVTTNQSHHVSVNAAVSFLPDLSETEQRDAGEDGACSSVDLLNLSSSSELAIIPHRFRPLLEYFQHAVLRSLSCHVGIQQGFCSTIIPISLQSPHLLAAVLCVSACHRRSAGLAQSHEEIDKLRSTAIQSLNIALVCPDLQESGAALATSLLLCLCEVVSPETRRDIWRLHLSGASALLSKLDGESTSSQLLPRSAMIFMKRIYLSLRAIALGCGMAGSGYIGDGFVLKEDHSLLYGDYIDDLAGFSTALLPVFDAIDQLETALNYQNAPNSVQFLIQRVRSLLAIRSHSSMRPTLSLSESTQTDFYLLDEAYHHMALLRLYRLAASPSTSHGGPDPATQASVRRIISCIADMRIENHPCPGVATLPPIFMAGRAATVTEDRDRIISLLDKIWQCFGMGNVTATKKFLKKWWGSCTPSSNGLIGDSEAWDFLPY